MIIYSSLLIIDKQKKPERWTEPTKSNTQSHNEIVNQENDEKGRVTRGGLSEMGRVKTLQNIGRRSESYCIMNISDV